MRSFRFHGGEWVGLVRIGVLLAVAGALAVACKATPPGGDPHDAGMPMPTPDLAMAPDDLAMGGATHDAAAGDDLATPPQPGADMSPRSSSDWMGALPAATSLAALSIPGTHDSGARVENTPGTVRCQALTVPEQLAAGVRYLDIRVRNVANKFEVYHTTVDQNLSFDDVLASIAEFFASHPGETVLMSFKEEQPATGSTNTFEQTFDAYTAPHLDRWYLLPTIPTLGQARGKIVLVRRFATATPPKGIDATNWADNTTFSISDADATLRIQDYYEISDDDAKWATITSLFAEAKQGSPTTLFLNNTSAYLPRSDGLEDIPSVSNVINPKLLDYFTSAASGRYGIVAMDFADAPKCALILGTNFK